MLIADSTINKGMIPYSDTTHPIYNAGMKNSISVVNCTVGNSLYTNKTVGGNGISTGISG